MAKLLYSVNEVPIAATLKYWRRALGKGPGQIARVAVAVQTMREMWQVHDAWIYESQSAVAHEAQPQLLAINKLHQRAGVDLAKVEAALKQFGNPPSYNGDRSMVWLSVALPLAWLHNPLVVRITSVGNQLRALTEAPKLVIQLDNGAVIPLSTLSTAAGAIAWWDERAQQIAETIEPAVDAAKDAVVGAYDAAAAAYKVVKGAAKGAAGLIASAPTWVPIALGVGAVYLIGSKR